MNQLLIDRSKIVKLTLISFVLVVMSIIGWYAFTHGVVDISSRNKEDVVTLLDPTTDKELYKSTGSLNTIVPTGKYIAHVSHNLQQVRTEIEVTPLSTIKKELTPPEDLYYSPVTNIQTSAYIADSTRVGLFDVDSGRVGFITNDNYSDTSHRYSFESMSWINTASGYGLASNIETGEKVLLKVDGTDLREIPLPSEVTRQTYFAYKASKDGALFIIIDGSLYTRVGETFNKIGTVNKENFIISTTSDSLVMLYRDSDEKCELQLYQLDLHTTRKLPTSCTPSPNYSFDVNWSSDGKKILVASGGEAKIYDSNFKLIASPPGIFITSATWDSDSSIVYTSDNSLWKYDIRDNISSVIAALPTYTTALGLQKTSDGIYYFIGQADSARTLYTISKSEPSTDLLKIAESNMYNTSDVCRMRYVAMPTLRMIVSSSEVDKDRCQESVLSYLSAITLDAEIPLQHLISEEASYSD